MEICPDASLHLESQAGQAYVTIRLGLGAHPAHVPHDFHEQKRQEPMRKKASPSRLRRRARRAAASRTTEIVADTEIESIQDSSNKDTTLNSNQEAEEVSVNTVVACNGDIANSEHACDLCDFTSKWSNGLLMHRSSIHELSTGKPKREEDQKVQDLTQEYWKSGNLVSNLQVYVNALLDVEKAIVDDAIKETEERKLEALWKEVQSSKTDLFPP